MTLVRDRGTPPIIIIGMHRSGTSMLARVLDELGVFMGKVKRGKYEAKFFRKFNEWLLHLSGAAWDNPEPTHHLLDNIELRALAGDYIRHLMKTPRAISFLGWRNYIQYRTPAKLDIPWGWKDPRNTYTLPLWLDLFPQAKIIHIYRNGVDVAYSLMVRSKKELIETGQWVEERKRGHKFERHPFPPSLMSIRCLSLEEGFALWGGYTKRADAYIASLPEGSTISIRYEDFLMEPMSVIRKLCNFSVVEPNLNRTNTIKSWLDPSRIMAYKRNHELIEFYESVRNTPQMRHYSY